MSKFKDKVFENIKSLIITLIIALILETTLFLLDVFLWHDQSNFSCSNAGFLYGSLTLGFGLLMILGNYGTFDMLSYGFGYLGRMIFAYKEKPKYKDYIEYKDVKNASRSKSAPLYLPIIIAGLIFIIIALIFQFLYIVERTNAGA